MKKEKIILEDGRYLIYYRFGNDDKRDASREAKAAVRTHASRPQIGKTGGRISVGA